MNQQAGHHSQGGRPFAVAEGNRGSDTARAGRGLGIVRGVGEADTARDDRGASAAQGNRVAVRGNRWAGVDPGTGLAWAVAASLRTPGWGPCVGGRSPIEEAGQGSYPGTSVLAAGTAWVGDPIAISGVVVNTGRTCVRRRNTNDNWCP